MKSILHILVGFITGILSGMGIGGGSILLLYLTAVLNVPAYTAGGMNLLYFLCCAPTALYGHIKAHRIEWRTVLWCAAGGILTAVPAAFLASLLPAKLLRRLFGLLLLYIAVKELRYKEPSAIPKASRGN